MGNFRCLIADIPQLILADIVYRLAEESEDIKVVERLESTDNLVEVVKKKILMYWCWV